MKALHHKQRVAACVLALEPVIRAYPGNLDAIDLDALWFRLVDDGLAAHVFHDGSVADAAQFIDFAGQQGRAMYAVYSSGVPAALFWLDCRVGRSCKPPQVSAIQK